MRKRNDCNSAYIVSAWSKESGFCLGQKAVEEKSNEIVAIPERRQTLFSKEIVEKENLHNEHTEYIKRK